MVEETRTFTGHSQRLCYEFSNKTEIETLYKLVRYCVLRQQNESFCSSRVELPMRNPQKAFIIMNGEISFYSAFQDVGSRGPFAVFALFSPVCALPLREMMNMFAFLLFN